MTTIAWIALGALFTSVCALFASIYFGWSTRDHNRRSVKPIPFVAPNDYENILSVKLWNYGSGPMILKRVVARDTKSELSGHLIDVVPDAPEGLLFDEFVNVQAGRTLPSGQCLELIQLGIEDGDKKAEQYRDLLRSFLGNVVVSVEYTDIYDTTFPLYTGDLKWFHRHNT